MHLEARAREPCGRSIPTSIYKTFVFLEHAGEVPRERQLQNEGALENALEEINMKLQSVEPRAAKQAIHLLSRIDLKISSERRGPQPTEPQVAALPLIPNLSEEPFPNFIWDKFVPKCSFHIRVRLGAPLKISFWDGFLPKNLPKLNHQAVRAGQGLGFGGFCPDKSSPKKRFLECPPKAEATLFLNPAWDLGP